MRKLLTLLFLLGMASHTYAQHAAFLMTIPDNSMLTSVSIVGSTKTPTFSDAGINNIIKNYTIYEFRKTSPLSQYEYARKLYYIECDDPQLANDLNAYNSNVFGDYEILPTPVPCSDTPNDYSPYANRYLDLINAVGAWSNNKGDSNVVIGISDTYFDLNHEDLKTQIVHVDANNLPIKDPGHGTAVAGFAAGATDNGVGFSSIGWRCKLDVSSDQSEEQLRNMVKQRGRKVVNASWHRGCIPYLDIDGHFLTQSFFNEIYDAGGVVCMAAGNGRSTVEGNNMNYCYPPALDHILAATNISWENDTPAIQNLATPCYNCKYVHLHNANDTVTSMQHNDRVDIGTPCYRVGALEFDPNDTSQHYNWGMEVGTSFGSPTIAGICGLMFSAKSWLTPYQIEYILKKTSNGDIYNVSYNKKYWNGPTRFTGRIGAGLVDAGLAVAAAKDYEPYDPATFTFRVTGIDINTLCTPDSFPGVPLPKLTVTLENGTPPYKYVWHELDSNEVTLSFASGQGSPTVTHSQGGHLVHYMLTVYDSSEVMKVANKEIKIRLRHDSTADLAMQDAYMDMLNEPNNMWDVNPINWNIWESPDLWNRQHSGSGTTHENPDYGLGQNYIHIKVRNVGCVSSTGETPIIAYWTLASTGETWDGDWIGKDTLNGHQTGDTAFVTGVSPIAPGFATEVVSAWDPPRPQDYDSTITELDACILARIVTDPNPPYYGMTFLEDTDVNINIRNNNNIVTRNMIVTNFSGLKRSTKSLVIVGNTRNSTQTYSLEFVTKRYLNPAFEGNLSAYLTATIYLGDLYDIWVNGGRLGTYTDYNDDDKTVTTDLATPLRLDNLVLDPLAKFTTFVALHLNDGVSVPYIIENEKIYMRQLQSETIVVDNGDLTSFTADRDRVCGAVSFDINILDGTSTKPPRNNKVTEVAKDDKFQVYPNPASDNVIIECPYDNIAVSDLYVIDVAGRTVVKESKPSFASLKHAVNVSQLTPGTYFIKLVMPSRKAYTFKIIKQ